MQSQKIKNVLRCRLQDFHPVNCLLVIVLEMVSRYLWDGN
jgi:hypothetical protein